MNLSCFLAQNAVQAEETKHVVSKRFLDDKKKPVEWLLKPVTSEQDELLRKACTKSLPAPNGRKGMYLPQLDSQQYMSRLAAACVRYPDLNDVALQDSYQVMGAEQLVKAMLLPGEYAALLQKIQEICGFDVSQEELAEEAKN